MHINKIYLNNAATGWPKAPGVVSAVTNATERIPEHGGRMASGSDSVITRCRKLIAQILTVDDPSRIVMTASATHALNLAIMGIGLDDHSHAVTTVIEHNSVLRPLFHIKERHPNMRLTILSPDNEGLIGHDSFETALLDSPSVVIMNHASNVTGRVYDVRSYFKRAKNAGAVTMLDATQTVGLLPVHPQELYADIVVFTGHKTLHGPLGSGAMYVAPHIDLEQVIVGGTGVRSDLMLHPPEMPIRLESGTPNTPAIEGLSAAIEWSLLESQHNRNKVQMLTSMLHEGLASIPGSRIIDAGGRDERAGIISFTLENWSVADAGMVLSESFGIECRTGLHCAPLIHEHIGSLPDGTIRFSVSGFNSEDDINTTINAVSRLIK